MLQSELAEMLDKAQYGSEISPDMEQLAKREGLVVVYGMSDDLMEFCGAIDYEADVWGGGIKHLTENGILEAPECDPVWRKCPFFEQAVKHSKYVRAVWNGKGKEAPWTYETDIPHATFRVYEDDDLYCIGIVFSVEDLR